MLLDSPELAGIHFTGSTDVFNSMWKKVGENIGKYRGYPRLVGETGGKDFIVVHPSADPQEVAVAIAARRVRVPGAEVLGRQPRLRAAVAAGTTSAIAPIAMMKDIKVGDVRDFRNFMGAVIDKKAFTKISGYLDDAKKNAKVLQGGDREGRRGLLHRADAGRDRRTRLPPAVRGDLRTGGHRCTSIRTTKWHETLDDRRSHVAVRADRRGVRARSRRDARGVASALRNAAGNFYINDKPTGAVVGQQPFGGARGSGTNDKAGSKLNLVRWVSARTVKETFAPPTDYKYPFMAEGVSERRSRCIRRPSGVPCAGRRGCGGSTRRAGMAWR